MNTAAQWTSKPDKEGVWLMVGYDNCCCLTTIVAGDLPDFPSNIFRYYGPIPIDTESKT